MHRYTSFFIYAYFTSSIQDFKQVLTREHELDDKAATKLQGELHKITDIALKKCLNECLEIRLQIDKFSEQINKEVITDKLNQEGESIVDNINKVNINEIISSIKDVKKQINSIKVKLQSSVEKLKEKLKQKENKLKEKEKIAQAQEKQSSASSSEANQDQFLSRETGAIPKQRNSNDKERNKQSLISLRKEKEQKDKQEAERLQKEKEQSYSNFKKVFTDYLEIIDSQVILSLFRDVKQVYNKKNNVPKTVHISEKNYKKFSNILKEHIKAYYLTIILNQLLENNCIDCDLKKFKNSHFCLPYSAIMCGNKVTVLFEKMKRELSKLGVNTSKYLDCMPNIENAKCVEYDLVVGLPNLYESLLIEYLKMESIAVKFDEGINLITLNNMHNAKTEMGDTPYDKVVFNDCCGKKYTSEFLEKVMEKHGYKEKVDKVLEELIKQHSPNSKVEGAAAEQSGACAQVEK